MKILFKTKIIDEIIKQKLSINRISIFPFLIFFTSLFFLTVALLFIDIGLGILIEKGNNFKIAKFPNFHNSTAFYETPEYKFTVKLNSLGFRGKDYQIVKPAGTIRILVIGNSFVYGWGLLLKDTWVNILENDMNKKSNNTKFELLNLGIPGSGPVDFLEIVTRYTPIFKPDFVLIGLVEANDINKLIKWHEKPYINSVKINTDRQELLRKLPQPVFINLERIGIIFKSIYPNIFKLFLNREIINVRLSFIRDMIRIINTLDEEDIVRYKTKMKPEISNNFMNGDLNPILFLYALRRPDYFIKILNINDPDVIEAEKKYREILMKIRDVIIENGARPIFLDIPYGVFVSKKHMEIYKDMGFNYNPSAWISDRPLEITKKILSELGVTFITNLDLFRKYCFDDCFFTYDDHLTSKGSKLLESNLLNFLLHSGEFH